MKSYIGFKVLQAEPCTVQEFNEIRPLFYSGESQEGYKVVYEDGYVSWSPKEVFEKAYIEIDDKERIKNKIWDLLGFFFSKK